MTYPAPPPANEPSDPWGHPGFAPLPPVSGAPPTMPLPAAEPPPPADPGAVIVQIGELGVTSTVVRTPAGDIPLKGSTWHVTDYWHNEQKIPTWAIVCAVAGFCVLTVFSLLFLLVKETIYRGTVQVTVTNGTRQYVARIPVTAQEQVAHVHQQVNYVRSLAAI
ncbi:hypothetical protein [Spirilliplanes yamanashiensis]|uniref:Uncharacterized protein n=1 Tax=Spirilliplanes yamanashiensis TaxID=42233 RepID=A0A8J3YDT4_9ACTN|nr:hypothetical protein [Spirilliplanes yamanashiensis]MDP9816378.1 hypothetical protein [Spirilliplanes yamanashiensis]GIJ05905.1 hypothetical protein Sya03_52570 [Spirilliplanes yamanashiensis]